MTADSDPSEILIDFVSQLPTTIRNDALIFVVIYGLDDDPDIRAPPGDTDLSAQIIRHLRDRGDMRLFSSTLRIVAALDYVLERQQAVAQRQAGMFGRLAEHGPEGLREHFRQTALREPLRERHFEQTLERWRGLRSNSLSPQSLRDFEDRCLRPRGLG